MVEEMVLVVEKGMKTAVKIVVKIVVKKVVVKIVVKTRRKREWWLATACGRLLGERRGPLLRVPPTWAVLRLLSAATCNGKAPRISVSNDLATAVSAPPSSRRVSTIDRSALSRPSKA